ncbi:MAG: sulfatase-like hydrolase/transferase, partial [bacterium]|nr:sulfatase-like hydrolase/transferase [bacterium]
MDQKGFSLVTALTVAAFFSFTLLVFGPAYIYFTNSLEFNFSFVDIASRLIAVSLALVVVLALILRRLKTGYYEKSISLLFALSVLLWVQGNLLVWNYGPLDGREIHWNEMWVQGLLDAGIWIGLLILAFKKSGWFAKIARNGSIAFILIQLLSVSMAMMRAPETPSFKRYYIDESQKYSFSSQRNVILLMLDTYQTDLFQEIIAGDERYKDIFRGFTYFRNSLSAFPKTYTSVPSFLTGRTYDNSIPMVDFVKEAYTSGSSLPGILKQAGYRVELYPFPGTEKTIYFSESTASNIKKRETGGVFGEDIGFLVDITLFRHIPHFSKRWVYNRQSWLLKRLFSRAGSRDQNPKETNAENKNSKNKNNKNNSSSPRFSKEALRLPDIKFISQLIDQFTVEGSAPVFKYYHLNGLHRPLVLDETLTVRQMPYSQRSSFKAQGKAALEITRLMLETLKSKGLFRNSLIIVTSDHGCADYPYGVNLQSAGLTEESAGGNGSAIPSHIKAAGLPMILIKPIGAAEEEMKISDAPVSLTDLPHTVFAGLGIEGDRDMPGVSMFSLDETQPRERKFYYYNWSGWGDGYLYHMREYVVSGHSWLNRSWRETRIVQPATAQKPYEYGSVIRFGQGGNAQRYQGIGWHGPQKNGFTWTREKRVEMFLVISRPGTGLVLEMVLKPYLAGGKLKEQRVHVRVNGRKVQTLTVTKPAAAEYRVTIPGDALTGSRMSLVFDIPTATAPVDLNIGTDVRTLGIALRTMKLVVK